MTTPVRSSPRRRVAFILHKFSRGGSDRVATHLARGFVAAGLEVELIVFCRGGEVEGVLTDLIGGEIPVTYLRRSTGVRALDLVLGLPAAIRRLRAFDPDVTLSTANNTAWASWAALTLGGLRRSKLALKTTNPVARSRHKGLVGALRRWGYALVFRRTDAVWALSPEEADELKAEFPRFADIFDDVVNPYVTPEMLTPPAAPPPPEAALTVVSLARLTRQKRVDRMIAAFAHVRTPGARLKVLGEGELRPALEAQIAALGVGDRVTLPGYVADVGAALHAARLYLLTSEYEGLPAAVLEAMAADCGVLGTDCFPAARRLLEGREGCGLIEDVRPAALAARIDAALATPRPAFLHEVAALYSVENGVASHLAALQRLG